MKKKDIAILIIGIVSLILMIVFKGIALGSAINTFDKTDGWKSIKEWFKSNDGKLHIEVVDPVFDVNDFVIVGDPDKVQVTEDGIHVKDGDDSVDVDTNGVRVTSDDEYVTVGKDGIVIKDDDHEITIGISGISVK